MTEKELEYLSRYRTNEENFNHFCKKLDTICNSCNVTREQFLAIMNSNYRDFFDFINYSVYTTIIDKRLKNEMLKDEEKNTQNNSQN